MTTDMGDASKCSCVDGYGFSPKGDCQACAASDYKNGVGNSTCIPKPTTTTPEPIPTTTPVPAIVPVETIKVNVSFTTTLSMSMSEFTPVKRTAYVSVVKTSLNIPGALVRITSVSEEQTRRRLLSALTVVKTSVEVTPEQVPLVVAASTFESLFQPLEVQAIELIDMSTPTLALPSATFELMSSSLDYTKISKLDFSGDFVVIEYLPEVKPTVTPVTPTTPDKTDTAVTVQNNINITNTTNDWEMFGLNNALIICGCVFGCYLVSLMIKYRKVHTHRKHMNHPYDGFTKTGSHHTHAHSLQIKDPVKSVRMQAPEQDTRDTGTARLYASLQTTGFMKKNHPS
ncbi:hypothetical protein T484DRAFT_1757578 [Baffinella frigidus]|nr:hypothetical protein T484DRAFT_1757578 [Cryptophyta sp. CCMP2293]